MLVLDHPLVFLSLTSGPILTKVTDIMAVVKREPNITFYPGVFNAYLDRVVFTILSTCIASILSTKL